MEIKDIKKGMLVQFSKEVIFTLSYRDRTRDMSIVSHLSPRVGIVMGITNKVTGHWHPSDGENQGYIGNIKTHKIVVIQTNNGHQKYYAPVFVKPEDCQYIAPHN